MNLIVKLELVNSNRFSSLTYRQISKDVCIYMSVINMTNKEKKITLFYGSCFDGNHKWPQHRKQYLNSKEVRQVDFVSVWKVRRTSVYLLLLVRKTTSSSCRYASTSGSRGTVAALPVLGRKCTSPSAISMGCNRTEGHWGSEPGSNAASDTRGHTNTSPPPGSPAESPWWQRWWWRSHTRPCGVRWHSDDGWWMARLSGHGEQSEAPSQTLPFLSASHVP